MIKAKDYNNLEMTSTITQSQKIHNAICQKNVLDNSPHIIKRTGKMIKIDRNNAFTELKFDTEGA